MGDRQAPASLVLVQELANTLDIESGRDRLETADDLARFVRAHELTALRLGERDLPGLRELREALRAACLAHTGSPVPPEAVAALDRHLSEAPVTLRLDSGGEARLRPAHGLAGLPAFTAHLAVRIATAAGDGTWARLKACEAHDCLWVYYDRSPAGRSRWCTMAVCGSRAKMRTYRARRAR
ncbi:CGNR zinc finger domain-containing protein [Streptomyces reniochalinae]|uniref:Zf-CGNR multi-domain protein n=1 Tax=Streptomyces reniochalinae TaxID=2250578 RepID=A0A367EYX8_9ACTN|nr:CGNR zinc finger domain-containing protein [Streptomyces reniochalinae]RCG23221.1 zf-CGNR multi-domain protein [Streptomyces reniochalinae]